MNVRPHSGQVKAPALEGLDWRFPGDAARDFAADFELVFLLRTVVDFRGLATVQLPPFTLDMG